jgi:hypothetical protein
MYANAKAAVEQTKLCRLFILRLKNNSKFFRPTLDQGCQMVYYQTENPDFGSFL